MRLAVILTLALFVTACATQVRPMPQATPTIQPTHVVPTPAPAIAPSLPTIGPIPTPRPRVAPTGHPIKNEDILAVGQMRPLTIGDCPRAGMVCTYFLALDGKGPLGARLRSTENGVLQDGEEFIIRLENKLYAMGFVEFLPNNRVKLSFYVDPVLISPGNT